jgi:hypothetical protein
MQYDTEAEFYFWPQVFDLPFVQGENECGICTTGAKHIARKF